MDVLLTIKSGNDYFRFAGQDYAACSFAKASVFPPDQIDTVRAHLAALKKDGIADARIVQLTITETVYPEAAP